MKTIADIAELAGVAKSTVSKYLNGGSISESTKKKIEYVINETGYVPNTFAQSLKAKKTNIIGTIVPRLDSFSASQVLIGIDEHLRALNYQMLISNTNQNLEREIESIYSMSNQKVAGIIILASQISDAHLKAFKDIKVPVILAGQQCDKVCSLIYNDESAAYDLGKYVLEKGHRKIAYLGVTERDISVGLKRKEGFKRAISEVENCEVKYYETTYKMDDAVQITSDIIESFNPSILVCATDTITLGALKAIHLKGKIVPSDVSITGFGGYEVTEIVHPSLTMVKYDYKDSGRKVADMLIKLVNGEEIPSLILSNYKINERESVDKINLGR